MVLSQKHNKLNDKIYLRPTRAPGVNIGLSTCILLQSFADYLSEIRNIDE